MTAWARRALLALLVLALSACTLDLDVNVEVHEDGSGAVEVVATVDAGALARVGGDLGAVLALDDLRADGWTVEGPTTAADGSATVRLRQGFADPAGASEVFADLAGDDGPLQAFEVRREQALFQTRWAFRGRVDLGGEVALPGVEPEVDGEELATSIDQLEEQLGDSFGRLVRLRVGVRLPGHVESNATTKAANGAVWQVAFGDPLDLDASGSRTRGGVVAAAVGLGLLVVVLAVVLLVRIAGRVTALDDGGAPGVTRTRGRAAP